MDDLTSSLLKHFDQLKDPRRGPAMQHNLIDIVMISVCAVICGADSWRSIALYGTLQQAWFREFLELPSGIPSHDTFARVFSRLNPLEFQKCFVGWINAVAVKLPSESPHIAIDGKTLRRSFDRSSETSALHLVSAWCSANSLVLGQIKTDAKSNEIPTILQLLDLIDIKGSTVTIDAIGCQKAIVEKIQSKGGDFVICLKGNQPTLHDSVTMAYDGACKSILNQRLHEAYETTEKSHGRLEVRRYWLSTESVLGDVAAPWCGVSRIGIAERETHRNGTESYERRYFLVSFSSDTARFAAAIRNHWTIENSLHWCMDVTFREDDSRIRKGHAPENFATLRRTALSLLKQAKFTHLDYKTQKFREREVSVKIKRQLASWNTDFRLKVLFGSAGLAGTQHLSCATTESVQTSSQMVGEVHEPIIAHLDQH